MGLFSNNGPVTIVCENAFKTDPRFP